MTEDEALVARLAKLVARGLDHTGQGPRAQITVAELHRRLVPYEDVHPELGVATREEYDATLLRFLHHDEWVEMEELALRQAVADELDAPEPGTVFLEDFSASPLRMDLSEIWESLEAAEEEEAAEDEQVAEAEEAAEAEEPDEPEREPADGAAEPADEAAEPEREPADGAAEPADEAAEAADEAADTEEEPVADENGAPAVASGECWNCEKELPDRENLRFCPWCGTDQTVRECPSCEAELDVQWEFCPACGAEAPD